MIIWIYRAAISVMKTIKRYELTATSVRIDNDFTVRVASLTTSRTRMQFAVMILGYT